jgi:hypothetical protein
MQFHGLTNKYELMTGCSDAEILPGVSQATQTIITTNLNIGNYMYLGFSSSLA